jgi:hypothetical protein
MKILKLCQLREDFPKNSGNCRREFHFFTLSFGTHFLTFELPICARRAFDVGLIDQFYRAPLVMPEH